MSALITCKSKIKHVKHLMEALEIMGVPAELITVSEGEDLVKLQGYANQTADVNICISKKFHRGYADAGFKKDEEGTYTIFVDDLDDLGSLARATESTGKFSDAVNQWYSAMVVKKTLKNKGLFPKIRKDGNKIRVLATAA